MSEEPGINDSELVRPTRLIRIREVQQRVGLGRSTIYRWMAQGKFPRPVRLGTHAIAWPEEVIDEWVRRRSD